MQFIAEKIVPHVDEIAAGSCLVIAGGKPIILSILIFTVNRWTGNGLSQGRHGSTHLCSFKGFGHGACDSFRRAVIGIRRCFELSAVQECFSLAIVIIIIIIIIFIFINGIVVIIVVAELPFLLAGIVEGRRRQARPNAATTSLSNVDKNQWGSVSSMASPLANPRFFVVERRCCCTSIMLIPLPLSFHYNRRISR